MNILHQIYPVRNRKIIVELPESFSATTAEVIVLPLPTPPPLAHIEGREEKTAVIQQFLTRDTSQFTAEQKETYQRICERLQQKQPADSERIAGLFAGFVQATNDFDAPLPDEGLFWGEGTDKYGVTLVDESPA